MSFRRPFEKFTAPTVVNTKESLATKSSGEDLKRLHQLLIAEAQSFAASMKAHGAKCETFTVPAAPRTEVLRKLGRISLHDGSIDAASTNIYGWIIRLNSDLSGRPLRSNGVDVVRHVVGGHFQAEDSAVVLPEINVTKTNWYKTSAVAITTDGAIIKIDSTDKKPYYEYEPSSTQANAYEYDSTAGPLVPPDLFSSDMTLRGTQDTLLGWQNGLQLAALKYDPITAVQTTGRPELRSIPGGRA